MEKIDSMEVKKVFNSYPVDIRRKLLLLRQLILDTASEIETVDDIEETLKWGEVAYVTKTGSTIRLGTPKSTTDQYAMYFHCKTTLLDTFKELYTGQLKFDGNRAIVFELSDELPVDSLKHCISLSLIYHRIKHLPLLGV